MSVSSQRSPSSSLANSLYSLSPTGDSRTEAFDERFFGADVAFLLIWTILPEKRASALYLNLTTLVLPEWSFLM